MAQRNISFLGPDGMHARPAGTFAKMAKQFRSDLLLIKGGKRANAKNMLQIVKLDIAGGEQLVLQAEGPDAEEALAALGSFFEKLE